MIEKRLYLKALRIVEAYHEQVSLKAKEISNRLETKPKFRNLGDVESTDLVKCIAVHASSSFTKDREYEVLRVTEYYFEIVNDNEKKKWVRKTNGHFKLM